MITPTIGQVYIVKHSSGLIPARFLENKTYYPMVRIYTVGRPAQKTKTHYLFQNLNTGRDIEIKSRVKIRSAVTE